MNSFILKHIKIISRSWRNFSLANTSLIILLLLLLVALKGCVVPYIPEPPENDQLLVVEGLISDQAEVNTIKISRSRPLWTHQSPVNLTGCKVWISDDLGLTHNLKETPNGKYITDPSVFKGKIGRKYTLHIRTNADNGNLNYESFPMLLKSVPEIDCLYYKKRTFISNHFPIEGCQIFLDTHDPIDSCHFYRWTYSEHGK
jgi:hypothetical protein